MDLLPSAFLDAVRADPRRWPEVEGSEGEAVVARIESALAVLPRSLQAAVVQQLATEPVLGRATLHALALAGASGAAPTGGFSEAGVIPMHAAGGDFDLGVLVFSLPSDPLGDRGALDSLIETLDGVFGQHRYMLYLKRAVPDGFEPGQVGRAVRLWVSAIDRGEDPRRHAVYEDDHISIELSVLGDRTFTGDAESDGGGLAFLVGPTNSLERMAFVDARLVDLVSRQGEESGKPLVVALCADAPWRMPRGYVEQLLYGTADWTRAVENGSDTSYRAAFRPSGVSLFSDPSCARLSALWWVEADGDALGMNAWSHDNPWADPSDVVPGLAGLRFARVEPTEEDESPEIPDRPDDDEDRRVVVAWRDDTP